MKNIPQISNDLLSKSDLPSAWDDWPKMARFAQSFDGYAHKSDLSDFADHHLEDYKKTKKLPDSLSDLRALLCYEQKRWRGSEPDYEAMGYIKALLEAIREKVRW